VGAINAIEAITQVAGSPSLISGNVARFRIDPTTGGLLVHVVAGGGGGPATAVTIADGADFALGSQSNSAATSDTGTFSLISLTKRELQHLTDIFNKDEEILLELQGIRSVIGHVDDLPAVSDTADDTQIALFKRLLQRITVLINQNVDNGSTAVLASTPRTAGATSSDFANRKWRGAHFIVETTALTGTPSVTFEIQGRNPVSGNYYTLLTSLPVTTTGTVVLKVYPGFPGKPGEVSGDFLPSVFRVVTQHGTADSITYRVDAALEI